MAPHRPAWNDYAKGFWTAYRDELRVHGTLEAYGNSSRWSPIAIGAARTAIAAQLGCEPCAPWIAQEYMRLDVAGFDVPAGELYRWWLRIAFEHENDNWREELCKLTAVVADLRVLVGYHDYSRSLENEIKKAVARVEGQISRVPQAQWLMIFGPRRGFYAEPFRAYTLNERLEPVKITDSAPLRPADFRTASAPAPTAT